MDGESGERDAGETRWCGREKVIRRWLCGEKKDKESVFFHRAVVVDRMIRGG